MKWARRIALAVVVYHAVLAVLMIEPVEDAITGAAYDAGAWLERRGWA